MNVLGIDIGGSHIKGCVVDTARGEYVNERLSIDTPRPAKVDAIVEVICDIIKHFNWKGLVGCGYPGVVQEQKILTAANLDKSCIKVNLAKRIEAASGCAAWVLNDADAAGVAELRFGVAKERPGVSLLVTIGTGLGTVFLVDGKFWVPNTELGHIYLAKVKAEAFAAGSVREREGLSWDVWGKRFNEVLHYYYRLFYPSAFILGGGVAKKFEKFKNYIDVDTEVIPAKLLNHAGIVGAATAAMMTLGEKNACSLAQ